MNAVIIRSRTGKDNRRIQDVQDGTSLHRPVPLSPKSSTKQLGKRLGARAAKDSSGSSKQIWPQTTIPNSRRNTPKRQPIIQVSKGPGARIMNSGLRNDIHRGYLSDVNGVQQSGLRRAEPSRSDDRHSVPLALTHLIMLIRSDT